MNGPIPSNLSRGDLLRFYANIFEMPKRDPVIGMVPAGEPCKAAAEALRFQAKCVEHDVIRQLNLDTLRQAIERNQAIITRMWDAHNKCDAEGLRNQLCELDSNNADLYAAMDELK